MDDRTRQLIEAYIPHPRDPPLQQGEYFFKREITGGPRIIRVFALDILPHRDGTEYGIYQDRGGRLVRVDARGDGDPSRGVHMYELYDNREDCRDGTHICFDGWEELRQEQLIAEYGEALRVMFNRCYMQSVHMCFFCSTSLHHLCDKLRSAGK